MPDAGELGPTKAVRAVGTPTFRKIRLAVRFAQVKEEPEGRGTRSKTHSQTDLERAQKRPSSGHWRQLGHTQRQPLGSMAWEVDLRPRIAPRAFQRQHRAFAKLGMEHQHAQTQAVL